MTPLRGELPLMPMGGHFEDIHVHCPAMWSWMAVLLQYWQDHMTPHLYGGRFHRISDLVATVIRDINPWLLHQVRFGWGYVAMNATLWIDQRDHFAMEHREEWAKQKEQECTLNDLERDTEVVYRACIIRRQEDKLLADSKEAAAKDLPPKTMGGSRRKTGRRHAQKRQREFHKYEYHPLPQLGPELGLQAYEPRYAPTVPDA